MSKEELNLDYRKAYEVFKETMREGDYLLAVKSALEKQIPKKPIHHIVNAEKIKMGNGYLGKGTTIYYCPNCKDFISRMYTYCHKCGQKLLWE